MKNVFKKPIAKLDGRDKYVGRKTVRKSSKSKSKRNGQK